MQGESVRRSRESARIRRGKELRMRMIGLKKEVGKELGAKGRPAQQNG